MESKIKRILAILLVVSFVVTLTASAVSALPLTIPGSKEEGNGNVMSWMNPSGVTQDKNYMHEGMAKIYFDNGGDFEALPGVKMGWVHPGSAVPPQEQPPQPQQS